LILIENHTFAEN